MAIREVLQLGNPKLRESAVRVAERASEEIRAPVEDLADTLLCWRNCTGYGRAIAAP